MPKSFISRINSRVKIAGLLAGITVCCGLGCGSSSSTVPSVSAPPSATGPKLVVVGGDTFNFGTTEIGQEFEHVFEIKNEGDADAEVTAGPPSCTTCTSFKLNKDVVKPHETLQATVRWHIKNENPEFRQYAPVEIKNGTPLKLHVVGKVAKRIVVSPSGIWNIGNVIDGHPKQFQATITSQVLDHFDIASVTSSQPTLQVTASPLSAEQLEKLKVKSGYDLNAVLSDTIGIGQFKDRVTINVLDPKPIPIIVDVNARRAGPVQIFGSNWNEEKMLLNAGSFDPKQEFITRLNLFTPGMEGELKIEQVTCVDPRFSVELKVDERFRAQSNGRLKYDLIIKVAPSHREVVYTLNQPLAISIETNQPKAKRIDMKWRSAALP